MITNNKHSKRDGIHSRRSVLKGAGTAGSVAVAGLAGCLSSNGGTEEGVVRIPGIHDTSGATSDVGAPSAEGTIDTINHINGEELLDVEIDHPWVDYAYDVAEATRAYDDYTSGSFPPGIIGWGTADTEALSETVAADEIVYVSASYSEALMTPNSPYNFFGNLDYTSQGRVHLEWIAENDPGASVAYITNDTPFGLSPVEGGMAYAEELGLEVHDRLSLALDASSAESQLRRAREDGIEYLIHQNTSAPMEVLVSDREDVYPEVNLMGLTYTLDEMRVEDSPEAYEGVRYASAFKTFDEALETDQAGTAIEAMFERRDETLDDREVANLNFVRGIIHALIMYKGLSNALERGLGVNEGSNLRQGLFDIDDWGAWGLIEPITYAEDDRRPTMAGRIYEVQDGEMVYDDTFELERRMEWIEGDG